MLPCGETGDLIPPTGDSLRRNVWSVAQRGLTADERVRPLCISSQPPLVGGTVLHPCIPGFPCLQLNNFLWCGKKPSVRASTASATNVNVSEDGAIGNLGLYSGKILPSPFQPRHIASIGMVRSYSLICSLKRCTLLTVRFEWVGVESYSPSPRAISVSRTLTQVI